jgi:hypothetical protein
MMASSSSHFVTLISPVHWIQDEYKVSAQLCRLGSPETLVQDCAAQSEIQRMYSSIAQCRLHPESCWDQPGKFKGETNLLLMP